MVRVNLFERNESGAIPNKLWINILTLGDLNIDPDSIEPNVIRKRIAPAKILYKGEEVTDDYDPQVDDEDTFAEDLYIEVPEEEHVMFMLRWS